MKIKIEGMMCDHCAAHVKEALAGIAGLSRIEVDLKAGSASVEGSAPKAAICVPGCPVVPPAKKRIHWRS